MFFRQGHTYIGGASVPFIVTDGMILDGAKGLGFDSVELFDRDAYPIGELPRIPPGTDDDWDTIAIGRRAGPSGEIVLPSGVRWVVDLTPDTVATMPPAQTPPPAQFPPSTDTPAGWTEAGPPPGLPGNLSLPKGNALPLVVGFGVIGGAFFAYQMVDHFFVEGLESQEKKKILIGAAIMAAWFGGKMLFNLDKEWWFSVEGMANKAEEMVK